MKGFLLTITILYACVSLIESLEFEVPYNEDDDASVDEDDTISANVGPLSSQDLNIDFREIQSRMYDVTEKIRLLSRDNIGGIYNRAINELNGVMDSMSRRLRNLYSTYR
uniref:Uncharacterized protein n=1 Tax=Graphocephala atropunctata TaxID=36148 RepID=A0A1B6M565_9HEMI